MTPYLAHDIEQEEGRKLASYRDSMGVWTVGVGHTADVKAGQVVSDAWATGTLQSDINAVVRQLDVKLPWWRVLDDVRQDTLVSMAFQLGVPKLLQFSATLSAMQRGDYALAADCMLKSLWAKQTPQRARRMAMQMRSGVRAWARAPQKPTTLGEPETDI